MSAETRNVPRAHLLPRSRPVSSAPGARARPMNNEYSSVCARFLPCSRERCVAARGRPRARVTGVAIQLRLWPSSCFCPLGEELNAGMFGLAVDAGKRLLLYKHKECVQQLRMAARGK